MKLSKGKKKKVTSFYSMKNKLPLYLSNEVCIFLILFYNSYNFFATNPYSFFKKMFKLNIYIPYRQSPSVYFIKMLSKNHFQWKEGTGTNVRWARTPESSPSSYFTQPSRQLQALAAQQCSTLRIPACHLSLMSYFNTPLANINNSVRMILRNT